MLFKRGSCILKKFKLKTKKSLLHVLKYESFPVLFIPSFVFEIPFKAISFQPEEIPFSFLVVQFYLEQIPSSFCLPQNIFLIFFILFKKKTLSLDTDVCVFYLMLFPFYWI